MAAWLADGVLRGKGESPTMACRTKIVFLLIVYFAGFATAVYCLAPAPKLESREPVQMARVQAALRSQDLARSVNSGMHKCIGFGKEAAKYTAGLIREKLDEATSQSEDSG
jgi:hypothetical protein